MTNSDPRSTARRFSQFLAAVSLLISCLATAAASDGFVASAAAPGSFPLAADGKAAPLSIAASDHAGARKVAADLQADIERVTGVRPTLRIDDAPPQGELAVLIGTIGKSPLIDRLVEAGKLDAKAVAGRWETFGIQTLEAPLPGLKRALVVFGSDKRGTIFGMYEISKQIGVSPWHWWADAPPRRSDALHVEAGFHTLGEPKVKYRGIFINDEAPALTNWAKEKFGGFNSQFYEHVFELILRHKANYLWPAMWVPAAFYEDDPENARLADEMGIVIATTHHEPMGRAHAEWDASTMGPWNYETNREALRAFWRGGVERLGDTESVVTIGMRGDGDEAMTEDTAVDLLQRIIADQRAIIEDVSGKPASETPQVWALYKEVQDYWDKGMRVPDDVIVLLCDDNWGNVRILPKAADRDRAGGFGMYYHFDFVGGPVSYRWLNVTQIERVWEQMNLSYEWGARELWLVNVGDIKPMELPISFFLDFAWNPEAIEAADLPQYYVDWARLQFGDEHAEEIAEILSLQTKYNARRTPEMLAPDTYSLERYREADRILAEYQDLVRRAKLVYDALPEDARSAFYQLALFPTEISCNLNEMYVAAGKNQAYGAQARASANEHAKQAIARFEKDAELTRYFHEELEDGKWNHMMSQTRIGYTSWNNPPANKMPGVSFIHPRKEAGLAIAVEHGGAPRGGTQGQLGMPRALPPFDPANDQRYYIEIINTGEQPLSYAVNAMEDWIQLSATKGVAEGDEKVYASVDWSKAPSVGGSGRIVVSGAGRSYEIAATIRPVPSQAVGYIENNGVVSIPAARHDRAFEPEGMSWTTIPNLGRDGSAVTIEPANAPRQTPGPEAPRLEYQFTAFEPGQVTLHAYLSPTLNYQKSEGLKYAVAIDDEPPRIVNMHEGETAPDWEYPQWWNQSVTDHIKIKTSVHQIDEPGPHTLKIWAVDPGVVFQKFVVDAGGLKPSYLGPPESKRLAPADSSR